MKKLRFIMALFGAVALTLTLAVPPANAAVSWIIKGLPSQKCIDNPNSSTANVQMAIWNCGSPKQANQAWVWRELRQGEFSIMNVASLKCLTVKNASKSDNAAIIQYDCNGGNNQRWNQVRYISDFLGHDYYTLQNVNSLKCLTVKDASTATGAKLLQFKCNAGTNQAWTWMV